MNFGVGHADFWRSRPVAWLLNPLANAGANGPPRTCAPGSSATDRGYNSPSASPRALSATVVGLDIGQCSGSYAATKIWLSVPLKVLKKDTAMYTLSRIAISCAVILMTFSAALSDGGLPQFDIQKQCQKTQRAADELIGTKNPGAFDSCVRNEQSAREKLVERWATTSALDKTSCVHPTGYSPSYSEWLGCLDTRDLVRTMRKDHPESMAASELCPKVNWQKDGSITSVVACQQR